MPNYCRSFSTERQAAHPLKTDGHTSLVLLMLIVSTIMAIGLIIHFDGHHLAKSSTRAKAVSLPTISVPQAQQLLAQVNQIITNNPSMDIGVAVQDLNSSQSFVYGEKLPFVAASISKLLTAADYLHGVQKGSYSLNQSIDGYTAKYELRQMIVQSDNDAWANFNDLLTHDGLKAYTQSIGLTNYDPNQNTLTVSDITLLLRKLYRHQLLNGSNTNLLLSYMQNANEKNYIVASIPTGVRVYHKAGWLDDRVNDAAIIDNGKHPYILVIFTKDTSGDYNVDIGHQIYADITSATTKIFL
jgi:beta-lactamase class A